MTDTQQTRGNAPPEYSEGHHHGANELEEYAGGYIEAWVGHIPAWLLAVYAVLFSGPSTTATLTGAVSGRGDHIGEAPY